MSVAPLHRTAPFHIRQSLARGMARQVFEAAGEDDGAMCPLLETLFPLTPNRTNRQRIAARALRLPGVVHVGGWKDGLACVLRTHRLVTLVDEAGEAFCEPLLVYTRVTMRRNKGRGDLAMSRVTFSRHAVERLVQRSDCALDGLLAQLDAEAQALLRAQTEADLVAHDARAYRVATYSGLWAGHQETSEVGAHWPLSYRSDGHRQIPTFNARTFLSPDVMNSVAWAVWQGEDVLALAG